MPKFELTDPFIRHHPNPEKRVELYDKAVSGLAVRITPKGRKSFVYRYYFAGENKRITIGTFPKCGLADARNLAKQLARKVSDGIDPLVEKQERMEQQKQPGEMPFYQLCREYENIKLKNLKPKTVAEHKRIIDNELIPALGDRPVTEISRVDLIRLLDDKAITNGRVSMANHMRARLHSIFKLAVNREYIESNPVAGIEKYDGESKRERYYNEHELQALWPAFETLDPPISSVFKILLLCGQRSTETRWMKWENIENGVWTIPKSLSKSDREHTVPLSDYVVDELNSIAQLTGNCKYVFESPRIPGQPVEWLRSAVQAIRKESGISDFKVHDLRRTAATFMARLGADRTTLGKILNHKGLSGDNQVTAIYDRHEYLEEKRLALQKWADHLRGIIAGDHKTKIYKINS